MAKQAAKGKEANYTIPGLLALVGIVLVTAMYFARLDVSSAGGATSTGNLYGAAIGTGQVDNQAPSVCEPARKCDGSKLVIQTANCKQYTSYCTHGCDETAEGAICR